MALKPAAMFYSSRTMLGLTMIVAELERVSAGRIDHRPYKLAGQDGRLALTTAWILMSFDSTVSLAIARTCFDHS